MPFGKWKGVRIRLLPDDYLSWLTSSAIMTEARWGWLKESLIAELKFRGMRYDLSQTMDIQIRATFGKASPGNLARRAVQLEDTSAA